MANKTYTGINVQWPISELILSGVKTIETRTYPIPANYINREMILIETPGKNGDFKARIRAIVVFRKCFKYKNKADFYRDTKHHCVTRQSQWAWSDKPKWGWEIELKKVFNTPLQFTGRKGIIYTKRIKI